MNALFKQTAFRSMMFLLLTAVAPICAGCYTTTQAELYYGEPMSRAGLVQGTPTVQVAVTCDWTPESQCQIAALEVRPDAIAHKLVVLELWIPLIFGTHYTAPPQVAKQAYSKMLSEELCRVGFCMAPPETDTDCTVELHLANADYDWRFLLLGVLPLWNEACPLLLAAEAQLTTPSGTFSRKFKIIEEDAVIPDRIGPLWRQHASQVAEAVAQQYQKDQTLKGPVGWIPAER
ncbi:MAG: hypothetical protein KJ645_01445 [Planctomycetes bacterium]|nr:hypothetical protein [Planctomycetota bacterium]